MPYQTLLAHLDGASAPTVVTLPDGSVDRYCRVLDGRGSEVTSRGAFATRIADEASEAFRLRTLDVRPGGQAVNAARQAAALGDDVTLFGHLDHPVFDGVSCRTYSMGAPARVTVLVFDDAELMLSAASGDVADWSLSDLRATAADVPKTVAAASAVYLANWVSMPGLSALVGAQSALEPEGIVVFDPGDVTGSANEELRALRENLRRLATTCDVVVTADGSELAYLADGLGCESEARGVRERALRRAFDASAVVCHEVDEAVAAAETTHRVANFEAEAIRRRAGAGDRFDAGLVHGLAAGLDWRPALALGNACASYYVEHDETASRDALRGYVDAKSDPEN